MGRGRNLHRRLHDENEAAAVDGSSRKKKKKVNPPHRGRGQIRRRGEVASLIP